MRILVFALLAVASPAAAQPSQDTPASAHVAIDIMDMTINSRGGVDPSIVLDASDITVTHAYRCFDAVKPRPTKLSATVTLKFRIDNHGAVATVTAAGLPSVNSCLTAALKEYRFNTPNKGAMDFTEKLSFWTATPEMLGAELTGTGPLLTGFDDIQIYGGLKGDSSNAKRLAPPVVTMGQPTIQGGLDMRMFRWAIHRDFQKIRACYDAQLADKPRLAGAIQTQFSINLDGAVTASTASGVDAALASCVADAIQHIEFPRPMSVVTVTCPFVFHPARNDKKP